MRNIIYLVVLGGFWLFSACQDITVGYLETENANYPIDTLHIMNAEQELARLKGVEQYFYSYTQELQDKISELQEKLQDLRDELEDSDEYWDAYDELIGPIEDKFFNDEISYEEYNELTDQALEKLDDMFGVTVLKEDLEESEITLENLAEELGIGSVAILKKQIEEYQQKIDFKLPWASSEIQGVAGTQPLLFTVVRVKSDNQDAADKFMKYVGVQGDGKIYVTLDVDVPTGNYTVSLEIKNEGRTRILEDIFTFVMDEVPTENQHTPGE